MKAKDKTKILFWTSMILNFIFFAAGIVLLANVETEFIKEYISQFGAWAPAAYILVFVLLFIIPFNPIPKAPIALFALVSFGPTYTLIYTLLADLIGVLFNYYIAARFHQYFSRNTQQYLERFRGEKGWIAIGIFRVIPITQGFAGADFPSYAAGIIRMPLTPFLIATFIPWIIIDAAYFYLGDLLIGTRFLIPLLIAFAALTIVYAIYKARK